MASILACRICGQVHAMEPLAEGMVANCSRCGSMMEKKTHSSLHMTAAFSLAALILYFPANIFPILHMEVYGAVSDNTAWSGMQTLFQEGDYPIGVIVFLASILIPFLKLVGLFFLVVAVKFRWPRGKLQRVWMYRVIDAVGRWAMLDVFVVAILVSLVKLEKLATVIAGPGLLAFGGVVVCTILASQSFDPQLVWNDAEEETP
jgi:paraquat-inducible protein A